MIGKVFMKVLFVLTIGVLHCTALRCKTNNDCVQYPYGDWNSKGCCYKIVDPPRCVNWYMCRILNRSLIPTGYPFHTIRNYNKFTLPPWKYNDKFTVIPNYNKFPHLSDRNKYFRTLPDYNMHVFDHPTLNFNNNDYYDDNNNEDSHSSPGAIFGTVVATLFLSFLIFCFRYLRYRRRLVGFRQNCIAQPRAERSSRTNIVSQGSEQPSRIVIISIRGDEENSAHDNRPPDGEPPFLSEEDILRNTLQNVSAPEPPPYEEDPRTETHHPPKYEDIFNTNDQPPPSEYGTGQETPSERSISSPPVQQNLQIPEVNPPRYEEVQTASPKSS